MSYFPHEWKLNLKEKLRDWKIGLSKNNSESSILEKYVLISVQQLNECIQNLLI